MIRQTLLSLGLVAAGLSGAVEAASAAADKASAKDNASKNPHVVFETNKGKIKIELFADKAPISTKNFLKYVRSGFYEGTVFHRVIPGFVIQGGGFTKALERKETRAPIENEADNGLKNERGTLSMARRPQVDSATSQFFINLRDNASLDHRGSSPRDFGYAVFGKVVEGMDVVDAIAKVKRRCPSKPPQPCKDASLPKGMRDVPKTPIIVEKARRIGAQ